MKNNSNQTHDADIKNQLIDTIREAENKALNSYRDSIDYALFKIDDKKINDDHKQKLLDEFVREIVTEYANINNLYKEGNDQFYFMNSQSKNKGEKEENDNYRIESIVYGIQSLSSAYSSDSAILDFVDNLFGIVLKTRTLELKMKFFKDLTKNNKDNTSEQKEIEAVEVKQSVQPVKSKKDTVWFKVGILFADGTMDNYWNEKRTGIKDEFTSPKIAKAVDIKNGTKYINGTFYGWDKKSNNRDKNIFNDSKKVNLIIDHLKEHSIEIAQSFLDKVQTETNV